MTSVISSTVGYPTLGLFMDTTLGVSDQDGNLFLYDTSSNPASLISVVNAGRSAITAIDSLNGAIYMTLFGESTMVVYSAGATHRIALPEVPDNNAAFVLALDEFVYVTLSASILQIDPTDHIGSGNTLSTGNGPNFIATTTIRFSSGDFTNALVVNNKTDGTLSVFSYSGRSLPQAWVTLPTGTTTATKFVIYSQHVFILDTVNNAVNIIMLPTFFGFSPQQIITLPLDSTPFDICLLNNIIYVSKLNGDADSFTFSSGTVMNQTTLTLGTSPAKFISTAGPLVYITNTGNTVSVINTNEIPPFVSSITITNPPTSIVSSSNGVFTLEASGNLIEEITTDGTLLAPTNLVATPGLGTITISWTPSGSTVTGYQVYRSSDGGSIWTPTNVLSKVTTLTTLTGLANSTTYLLYVKVFYGNIDVGTQSISVTTPPGVASDPSALTGTAGDQSVALSWTASPSPVSGYIVYMRLASDNTYGSVAILDGSTTTATISTIAGNSLANGSAYTMWVTAFNGTAYTYSTFSNDTNSINLTPLAQSPPGAPTSVVATSPASSTVNLAWSSPTPGTYPITSYTVARRIDSSNVIISTHIDISGTSAVLTSLTNGTPYTFVVAARNSVGLGSFSAPSNSITPTAPVTDAVTNFRASDLGDGNVRFSWNAAATPSTSYILSSISQNGALNEVYTSVKATADVSAVLTGLSGGPLGYVIQASLNGTLSPITRCIDSAPRNLTGTQNGNSLVLNWSPPLVIGNYSLATNLQTYRLYVSANGSPFLALSDFITTPTYTISTMPGSTYRVQVAAVSAQGESDATSVANAPTQIACTTTAAGSATVTWTAPTNNGGAVITNYTVYNSNSNPITTNVSISGTTATLTNLPAGVPFQFTVSATNRSGTGAISAPSNRITVPSAPTNVISTSTTSGAVILNWTAPISTNSSIQNYTVYGTGSSPITTNITLNGTTATLTGLTNGTAYTFSVSATNTVGTGTATQSNTIVTSAAMAGVTTFLSSGVTSTFAGSIYTTSTTNPTQAILDARSAIANTNNQGLLSPSQRQQLTVVTLAAINATGNTITIPVPDTASIVATLASVNTSIRINTALPTIVVVPSFSTGVSPHTATVSLTSNYTLNGTNTTYAQIFTNHLAYVIFELPNSITGAIYQLTLTNGAASITLKYDGTILIDNNGTTYTASSTLSVGSVTIPLLGLGSFGGGSPSQDSTLSSLSVNSSNPLTAPYTYTTPSNRANVPLSVITTEAYASVAVNNAVGTTLFTGTGTVVGSLPLVAGSNTFTIHVTAADGTSSSDYPLTITNPAPTVPCFPAGTNILTASGYKKVESIVQGELVLTADGRQVPVKIYGKFIPVTTPVTAPFRIPRGVFGLQKDLLLSPDHAFQIRKGVWMIPKRAALMSERIEQISVGNSVTYYHLECPQYLRDNLVVDGTVVESYAGKQLIKGQGLPYTYNERLKGYTRTATATATAATATAATAATAATKFLTKA